MNWDTFKSYIYAYREIFSLTKTDLIHMPYIYLYSLGLNYYAYRSYITGGGENPALLEFSSRRTAICRFLYAHAADLSAALSAL